LELLLADKVYFADPSTFNDPLDTRPRLKADLDNDALERLLVRLAETRLTSTLVAAAKTMTSRGPTSDAGIATTARLRAQALAQDIDYEAGNPDFGVSHETAKSWLLRHAVEVELLKQYDKGILSLALRYDCPLMWSHYGDQHRGICFGYSVPPGHAPGLHRVHYGGSRHVLASDVVAMLNGDANARRRVDEGVLLRKAYSWRYEKEWRLIGKQGLSNSPLELEEVVFGLRCPGFVIHAVTRALKGRERAVKLYVMEERPGTFILKRTAVDVEQLAREFPRRALTVWEAFNAIEPD
jgi:hypothetical protein